MHISKKNCFLIIFLIVLILLALFIIPPIAKKQMLKDVKENYAVNKKLEKIEYIKYEDEPFMSIVLEKKSITSTKSEAYKLLKNIDTYKPKILNTKDYTNEILYYHFKDKTKLICYIDNDCIGVDNAKTWIKGVDINSIKKQMKDVKIVTEVK